LGISFDTPEENKAFAEKFQFPFKLLSDTDRKIGLAYGACDSPTQEMAKRIAYVIENGKITKTYKVKDAAAHPEQVLADLA
jgi:thioredoxin-dependent peroxiredoxin